MKVWHHLLLPLTPLYAGAVRARAAAYRRGLLRSRSLPVPVISVGNLTFGGTGKTPTVMALVRDLVRRGRRPAVLTRGYGRASSARPLALVGPEVDVDPALAGDEPVEMARRLPGVPVVVDADRLRSAHEAVRFGADTLVLDDGFQHLRVARDLDLVLVDAGDPWGGGMLPPRGRLREPVSALGRATAVMVTKLSAGEEVPPAEIVRTVGRFAPGAPVLGSRLVARVVRTPEGRREPGEMAGRRVFGFAGLGRPDGFEQLLDELGFEVVGRRWFPDHHPYTEADIEAVVGAAAGVDAVAVTTGKDAAKLPAHAPVWVVEVEMVPVSGSWDDLWALCPRLGPAE